MNTAGLAGQGTRLIARFSHIPAGMKLYATIYPLQSCPSCGPNGAPAITAYPASPNPGLSTSFARLVMTDADGGGAFSSPTPTHGYTWGGETVRTGSQSLAQIPLKASSGIAVSEILCSIPYMCETYEFGIGVAYDHPSAVGTAIVAGGLTPNSKGKVVAESVQTPRFIDNSAPPPAFSTQPGRSAAGFARTKPRNGAERPSRLRPSADFTQPAIAFDARRRYFARA